MSMEFKGMKALVMAGGTGGHVFPALAVAQHIVAGGGQVHWLGSQGGMEVELVTKHGFAISTLPVAGVRGGGVARKLSAPLKIARSVLGALAVIRREQPTVVIGFGGFASGPGGVAARLAGVPLVVHEQNAIAGLTNKLLSRIAARVLVAFPQAKEQLPSALVVGNPVREVIRALPAPEQRYAGRSGALRVLVVGGSLGAQALNTQVPDALARVARDMPVVVRHQAGRKDVELTRGHYARVGIAAEVTAFIDDMAAAYGWADLVVCRAGALTVSELAAAGVPSILVPFPHAVDDHQTHNAGHLVQAGAARLLPQSQLDGSRLAAEIGAIADRENLLLMAKAARSASFGDASAAIARTCLEVSA
ncbi:MAG: undecaprenyldiphospho-muramoylpentapeptide beta-N-acetylglucosaminyltransferase [Gammaproteobacteria bacterium]